MYFRGPGNESKLAPISENQYKMLNIGEVDLRVTFKGEGNKKTMVVVINDGDPIISETFTPPNYDDEGLKEFTGTYYSAELSTSYTLFVKDGKIFGKHRKFNDFEIQVEKADLFSANGDFVRFIRDSNNTITGLKITTGRVRNLHFDKVK